MNNDSPFKTYEAAIMEGFAIGYERGALGMLHGLTKKGFVDSKTADLIEISVLGKLSQCNSITAALNMPLDEWANLRKCVQEELTRPSDG